VVEGSRSERPDRPAPVKGESQATDWGKPWDSAGFIPQGRRPVRVRGKGTEEEALRLTVDGGRA